jgi:hypothetical protein
VDNWEHFALYAHRLRRALDELVDWAVGRFGEVRVAVEVPGVPIGYQAGSGSKFQRLPLRDWIVPRQVAAAVLGGFPEAKVVRPDGYGRRRLGEYPIELRGRRPPSWGINEARQGERDHERAAFDVAGAGMVQPR